jgi:Outer membrane protein beta-barrel domain
MKTNQLSIIFTSLILFALGTNTQVSAQTLHVGATTAINATFVLDNGLNDDPRYNTTFTYKLAPIGLAVGLDFKSGVALQVEGILAKQGQVFELINAAKQVVGKREIDLTYFQVPVMFKYIGNMQGKTRFNFMAGPQLAFLTAGKEFVTAPAGTYSTPAGIQQTLLSSVYGQPAIINANNTYTTLTSANEYVVASFNNPDPLKNYTNFDLQIAGGFGVDFTVADKIYISALVRASYGILDARGSDLVSSIKGGTSKELFGRRSNLLVGVQIGAHYTFSL